MYESFSSRNRLFVLQVLSLVIIRVNLLFRVSDKMKEMTLMKTDIEDQERGS